MNNNGFFSKVDLSLFDSFCQKESERTNFTSCRSRRNKACECRIEAILIRASCVH